MVAYMEDNSGLSEIQTGTSVEGMQDPTTIISSLPLTKGTTVTAQDLADAFQNNGSFDAIRNEIIEPFSASVRRPV